MAIFDFNREETDAWQKRSLAWQDKQMGFDAYMDAHANALGKEEKYHGKWLMGVLRPSGPRAFVIDLETDSNNYYQRLGHAERSQQRSRLIGPKY
ncbi:MAG: hypothetical protein HYU56_04340 [Candidatus Aenigmarchaeota archaeon]|nr:hypothetical protein [Candidatus Aenigmarchaeota archaeon]